MLGRISVAKKYSVPLPPVETNEKSFFSSTSVTRTPVSFTPMMLSALEFAIDFNISLVDYELIFSYLPSELFHRIIFDCSIRWISAFFALIPIYTIT
jgi:hypothetical protein